MNYIEKRFICFYNWLLSRFFCYSRCARFTTGCFLEIKNEIVLVDDFSELIIDRPQWIFLAYKSVPVTQLDESSRHVPVVHYRDSEDLAEDHYIDNADLGTRHVAHIRQIVIDLSQYEVEEFCQVLIDALLV